MGGDIRISDRPSFLFLLKNRTRSQIEYTNFLSSEIGGRGYTNFLSSEILITFRLGRALMVLLNCWNRCNFPRSCVLVLIGSCVCGAAECIGTVL